MLEAVDDFQLKLRVSGLCALRGVACVSAGATDFRALVAVTAPDGACLKCFFPELDKTNTSVGVLGPVPGVSGALAACLAVEILAGVVEPNSHILFFSALDGQVSRIHMEKRSGCPYCTN